MGSLWVFFYVNKEKENVYLPQNELFEGKGNKYW